MKLEYEISRLNKQIKVKYQDGRSIEFELQLLPKMFLEWQSEARMKMFEQIKVGGGKSVRSMPAHLPVLATHKKDIPFINLATKGLGLLPKESKIQKFFNLFTETRNSCKSKPWEETIIKRIETVIEFYENIDNFDPYFLGGLEIFEGTTFKNLTKNPLVSLLYTGSAPQFLSYQFNGIIEILQADNPYYQFLLAARELFAFDSFHIIQGKYPFGYLFYPVDIKEKTPVPRK
ncbi:MAG: hypothetical protein P8Y97_09380 [Candidatus Lokiarchaeota archaeon]